MATKTIVLTSGSVWNVPSDFNPNNNTIHAIGGGGGGGGGMFGDVEGPLRGGGGGKGGGYARRSNFNPGGRTQIPIQIGVGGAGGGRGTLFSIEGQDGGNGTPTIFDSAAYLCAPGGAGGVRGGSTGHGGSLPNGTAAGDVVRSGGNGGNGTNSEGPSGGDGGGGGGAAGANANGQNASESFGGDGGGPNGGAGAPTAYDGGHGTAWTDTATGIKAGAGGGGGGGPGGFGEGWGGYSGGTAGRYGAGGSGGGSGGRYISGSNTLGGDGQEGEQGVIVIQYEPVTLQPITFTIHDKTKVYGDADPAFTFEISSGSLQSGHTVEAVLSRGSGENVGTYQITGTFTIRDGSGNNVSSQYNITVVNGQLTITQRPVTFTIHDKTKVYGDTDPSFTFETSSGSLVSGHTVEAVLSRDSGESVGAYQITGTFTIRDGSSNNVSDQYNITVVNGQLTITQRPVTFTIHDKTKVYGGTDPAFTFETSSGSLVSGHTVEAVLGRDSGESVGTYQIAGTFTIRDGSSNNVSSQYNITVVNGQLTITQRPATFSADNKSKQQGAPDPPLTYQVHGLLPGHTGHATLQRVPGETPGNYPITFTEASVREGETDVSDNYNMSLNPGVLVITAGSAAKQKKKWRVMVYIGKGGRAGYR